MVVFLHKKISQRSVATHLKYDRIFSNQRITNLIASLPLKEYWKSVKIWRSYCYEFGVYIFGTPCITTKILLNY